MWKRIKAWLANISPDIMDFLSPILKFLSRQLIEIAQNSVSAGFAAGGSNEDKMRAALDYFKIQIRLQGRGYIESEARTLIELALQKAKKSIL